jgi:hypothetical protein
VLRRGSYDSLSSLGHEQQHFLGPAGRPGTARRGQAPAPLPAPTYEYRQRPNERLFEAPVTSVRAVVGPPQQRCWVERQQVVEDRGSPNVGGAVSVRSSAACSATRSAAGAARRGHRWRRG